MSIETDATTQTDAPQLLDLTGGTTIAPWAGEIDCIVERGLYARDLRTAHPQGISPADVDGDEAYAGTRDIPNTLAPVGYTYQEVLDAIESRSTVYVWDPGTETYWIVGIQS